MSSQVPGGARRTILFCFCAPAASGKSTISRAVVEGDPTLRLSISTTTRPVRAGEQEGVHYYFVDEAAFAKKVASGAFIEHAQFGQYRYGTERRNVTEAAASGCDLVLDIDVQGVHQLKQALPEQVVTIFVFPPSFSALKERLRARGTESDARQEERLRLAQKELEELSSPGFSDYLLINDELAAAIAEAKTLIAAERHRFSRFTRSFVTALTKEG